MPEEVYAVVAVISFLASAVAVWSAFRWRQLMRRVLRSLDEQQRRALGLDDAAPPADPPTANRQPPTD